jgi:glucokinase
MLRRFRNVNPRRVLGVDIGATKIEWVCLSSSKVESSGKESTDSKMQNSQLANLISDLAEQNNADCIGLSVAGFVDGNRIVKLPNIPNIKNLDLNLNVKTFVQNDLKCAALAVWARRKKNPNDSFILVSCGSGIGGAIVYDGRLMCGENNTAGEFGHMKFTFEKPRSEPMLVDWEYLSAGKGIEKQFHSFLKGQPNLNSKKYSNFDAKQIFESDSSLSKRLCSQATFYFGVGLANIANAFNPKEIILTGPVSHAYLSKYKKQFSDAFKSACITTVQNTVISKCEFENPCIMGSVLLTRMDSNPQFAEFFSK